jgi:hypothetical protein
MRSVPNVARAAGISLGLCLTSAALAASGSAHLHAEADLRFDCERPIQARDHPIHAIFDATLNPDKTATADLTIKGVIFTNKVHFDARLGGGAQPAPGGSSQLHVASAHGLRAIWDLPQSQLILDMNGTKGSCKAHLTITRKPGAAEYSMFDGRTFFYCSAYRLLGTSCQAE